MRASVGMGGGPDDTARSVASGADLGLDGKVALVTAASKGLGRGAASALAAEGAHVAINSRDPSACERRRRTSGPTCSRAPGDVTDPGVPARLVDETVERFGALRPGRERRRAAEGQGDRGRRRHLRDAIEANLRPRSVSFAPRCRTCGPRVGVGSA